MKWAYIHIRKRFKEFVDRTMGKNEAIVFNAKKALRDLDNETTVIQALYDIIKLSEAQKEMGGEELERFEKKKRKKQKS